MLQRVEDEFNRNINDPNYFNYKRTDPRDAVDQDGKKLVVPVDEESHDENKIPGAFVDRGQVKLEGGIEQSLADKIAHYHWDIMQSMGKNDKGTYDYKTRGDRYCCTVGLLNGKPAILSATTTPGKLQLLVGNEEIFGKDTISEGEEADVVNDMWAGSDDELSSVDHSKKHKKRGNKVSNQSTNKRAGKLIIKGEKQPIKTESVTGGVEGYNIPAAFSRKDGGSKKGLDGSNALGYELTPQGKKDFDRHPDRMIE